jgi:hypothetical protein
MFERGIGKEAVIETIRTGEVIFSYPDDYPYPSFLMLGFKKSLPIHAVVARDDKDGNCYVITVYLPKSEIWQEGFRERRES